MGVVVGRIVPMLAILAAMAPAVAAPSADSVKQTLQSLYNKEDAAAASKDVDGMVADYDRKVVAVMANGEQKGYDDIVAAARQVVGIAKSIKSTTSIKSITVEGSKAVAVTGGSVVMTVEEPTTHNAMTIATTSSSKDFWVRTGGRWKIVKSVEIEHSATVDGQPMPGV